MSCPRNTIHGSPDCNIVPHPDWPGQSFCGSCHRKFNENGLPFPIILVIVMLLAGFVMSVDNQNVTPRQNSTELQDGSSRIVQGN